MTGPKTGFNNQAQLASSDGTRAGAGFAPVPAGSGVEPLCDLEGRVWTRDAGGVPAGLSTRWQYPMAALAGSGLFVVIGTPGVLEQISGYTTGALGPLGTTYVQIYDGAPGIPVMEIPVVGAGTWAWQPGQGWGFATSILVGFSSVAGAFAAVAAGGNLNATGWQ
jgi:hypothetical protein